MTKQEFIKKWGYIKNRPTMNVLYKLTKDLDSLEQSQAELEKQESIYLSAVKGRKEFRQALKEARKKIKDLEQSHKAELKEFKKKVRKAMTCFNNEPENWHGGMDILNEIYKTP